jgi:hypothetical protein
MSPIKNLSEIRRLPRLGKIHLGIKVELPGKNPYPKAVDYFVCPPEVQAVFGEKPKALTVMFPVEDDAKFAQQWYRCYSMSRGLICRGDGETADRTFDTATGALANRDTKETARREVACPGPDCQELQKKQCRPVMNLQFLLPSVPGLGVWQLDTSSFYSIVNINSGIELIRGLCGRIAMIPLTLSLGPQEVTPEGGKKKTVWVLHLTSLATLADIQKAALVPPAQALLPAPEPPEEEEAPGGLFPAEVLDAAETAAVAPPNRVDTLPACEPAVVGVSVTDYFPEAEEILPTPAPAPTNILTWTEFWDFMRVKNIGIERVQSTLGMTARAYKDQGHSFDETVNKVVSTQKGEA